MPKKTKKHAMQMTDEDVLKHVFHPQVAKAIRKHLKGQSAPAKKRQSKAKA